MNISIITHHKQFPTELQMRLKHIFERYNEPVHLIISNENVAISTLISSPFIFITVDEQYKEAFILAQKIRESGYNQEIIFILESITFIYPCLTYQPFFIIRKKAFIQDLACFAQLLDQHIQTGKMLILNKGATYTLIPAKSIIYIEATQGSLQITTTSATYEDRRSLKEMKRLLIRDHSFIQIHRSYIIHIYYVQSFSRQEIKMKNQAILPIGKKYRPLLKQALKQYVDNPLFSSTT